MNQKTNFVFIITTDGSRPIELERLIGSFAQVDNAAVFMLLQNGSALPESVRESLPQRTVILHDTRRIPLSIARNRLLDQVDAHELGFGIDSKTVVLLADDDCWYSDEFFARLPDFADVGVCQAVDPESGKHFSTFNLLKKAGKRYLSPWELMFYGVSISFLFRYEAIKGLRFKENIGLGNKISQGEESLFVMRLLKLRPDVKVAVCVEVAVYHPWKFASSSNNHSSLGYFLGWAGVRGFSFAMPFYFFLLSKYLVATIVRPRKLYWKIFCSLGISFVKGMFDTKGIGAPNA